MACPWRLAQMACRAWWLGRVHGSAPWASARLRHLSRDAARSAARWAEGCRKPMLLPPNPPTPQQRGARAERAYATLDVKMARGLLIEWRVCCVWDRLLHAAVHVNAWEVGNGMGLLLFFFFLDFFLSFLFFFSSCHFSGCCSRFFLLMSFFHHYFILFN